MDRQDQLLENEDLRFHAIDKLGTGLGMIATEEFCDKYKLWFGLPSCPSIFLNLANNSWLLRKNSAIVDLFNFHPQGIWPDNHKALFDYFQNIISEIIFSYSAIESFCNQMIPNDYTFRHNKIDKKSKKILNKEEIERTLSLEVKLWCILPEILKVKSPKSNDILWDNFKALKNLRHRLIHLKSIDTKASGPENETIWGDLLRNANSNFCLYSYQMISFFLKDKEGFRWFRELSKYIQL